MANTNAEALIDTIRARAARTNDAALITEDFVLAALNEGQIVIVRKTPRQIDLDSKDATNFTISTDDTEKDIGALSAAHIGGIWILNGGATRQAGLRYMPLKEFRENYIPVSEEGSGEPVVYTRQGNKILFNCPVSSDYNGLYLHFDYTKWATALTNSSGSTSQLSNSDKGLIFFALAEIFDEIAISQPRFEQKALKKRILFNNWLEEFQDYNIMQLEALYEN